jgi:hyperosmotically inducible protein
MTGCTMAYKAAVDERNIKTIASDSKVKAAIVKSFINDKSIKTLDIYVAVYYGHVYLVGQYDTATQKKRAIKIAKATEGARVVTPHLLKKKLDATCPPKENLRVAVKLKGTLLNDGEIHATNVDVRGLRCKIVLLGLVSNKAELRKILAHAKRAEGVRGVKSYIKTAR